MIGAYLESHLYSGSRYAIIAVSRPSGTDQCLLESVRRETIKRELSHMKSLRMNREPEGMFTAPPQLLQGTPAEDLAWFAASEIG